MQGLALGVGSAATRGKVWLYPPGAAATSKLRPGGTGEG